MPEPIDTAKSDPLSEGTLRYRRNLLVICFVISILFFYPQIAVGNFSLFGVSIQGTDATAADIVWTIILILLSYQFFLFLIYCFIDFNIWAISIREKHAHSLIALFGISPPQFLLRRLPHYNPGVHTKLIVETDKLSFRVRFVDEHPQGKRSQRGKLATPINVIRLARAKLVRFWLLDFGLPFVWSCFSFWFAIERLTAIPPTDSPWTIS